MPLKKKEIQHDLIQCGHYLWSNAEAVIPGRTVPRLSTSDEGFSRQGPIKSSD